MEFKTGSGWSLRVHLHESAGRPRSEKSQDGKGAYLLVPSGTGQKEELSTQRILSEPSIAEMAVTEDGDPGRVTVSGPCGEVKITGRRASIPLSKRATIESRCAPLQRSDRSIDRPLHFCRASNDRPIDLF